MSPLTWRVPLQTEKGPVPVVNKLQSMSDRALNAQILVLVLCVIGLGAILFAVPDGRWAALPFIICVAGLLGFCGEGYRRWSIRRR